MIATDILLLAALVVFVVAWWARRLPQRRFILTAAALVALAAGIAGVLDDRWQDGVGAVVALIGLAGLVLGRLRKRGAPSRVPVISGLVFTLLAGLAAAAIVMFPITPLPKPSGAYPVGVRTFEVTDASRKGVFHAKPDEPRRLLVRVWYPAGDVTGRQPRPYFNERETQTTARAMGATFKFPPFLTYLRHVRTNSYEGAPMRVGDKPAPVVIYSHGYSSFLSQNTALMEDLASHGYVVFALQHTFDSAAGVFPNGDVAPVDPALMKEMASGTADGKLPKAQRDAMAGASLDARLAGQIKIREDGLANNERLARSAVVWTADRIFLHDALQAGAVAPEIAPILAASDLSRVGEMGMSFGGAISGSVCMVDPRCAAGINLDGADFPFQAFDTRMPVPFMMFHSDMRNIYQSIGETPAGRARSFNEFSYEPIAQAGTDPRIYRVQVRDSRHSGMSDFTLFMRRPLRNPLLGSTPSDVMIGVQNAFVRGFFDRYLRGTDARFPQAQEAAYAAWLLPVDVSDLRAWWAGKSEGEREAIEARIAQARGPSRLRPAASVSP